MRPNSLSFRLVVGAGVSVAVALIVAAVLLTILFRNHVEDNLDARLASYLDSLITVTAIDSSGVPVPASELTEPLFERPLSGWYWQISAIDGSIEPERSRSLWDSALWLEVAVSSTENTFFNMDGPEGQPLRAVARQITLPDGDTPFVFAVTADRDDIVKATRPFTFTLIMSLVVLGVVLVVAVFVQVRFGLGPLRHLQQALAAIRTGRAERLEGRFPAEVEPLAHELNALIDHNEKVVDRARTHVGNLAHALKTPLTVLTNEADRQEGPFAETVARQSSAMARQVDHYLARARMAARARALGARTDVVPIIADLVRTLTKIHAERGLEIASEIPDLAFRGQPEDLEDMVGNLLDNACKWARSRTRIAAAAEGERIVLTVEDDGPGLRPHEREAALKRGERLDESTPGSGLGLAIVADVAALYGGEITLDDSEWGGLKARLSLPRAD